MIQPDTRPGTRNSSSPRKPARKTIRIKLSNPLQATTDPIILYRFLRQISVGSHGSKCIPLLPLRHKSIHPTSLRIQHHYSSLYLHRVGTPLRYLQVRPPDSSTSSYWQGSDSTLMQRGPLAIRPFPSTPFTSSWRYRPQGWPKLPFTLQLCLQGGQLLPLVSPLHSFQDLYTASTLY